MINDIIGTLIRVGIFVGFEYRCSTCNPYFYVYFICKWIYLLKLYKREKVGTYGNL